MLESLIPLSLACYITLSYVTLFCVTHSFTISCFLNYHITFSINDHCYIDHFRCFLYKTSGWSRWYMISIFPKLSFLCSHRTYFCHIKYIPNIPIYRYALYNILKHWTGGFTFTFGSIWIECGLSDFVLILRVPNHRQVIDIESTTLGHMFKKYFRD